MSRICRISGFVLVLWFATTGGGWTGDLPKRISSWGIYTGDAGGEGVAIKGVVAASSAAEAGLQAGDVLLSVDGTALRSAKEFSAAKNAFPLYTPLALKVRRNGALIERRLTLTGLMSLAVKPLPRSFVIPGVPDPADTAALSAVDALDRINVLDQVVLDPDTGRIAVLGHYDDSYETGPIPYLDLLKTALANPEPRLNLHPTAETKKEIMVQLGRRDISFSFEKIVEIVRGHPGLEQDRQRMIRELAREYKLTPDEYVAWYNYVKLDQDKEPLPPPAIRSIQVKVFANLGYSEIARALELSYIDTSEALVEALKKLGRGNEAGAILARGGGDATHEALQAATYLEILKQADPTKSEVAAAVGESYNAGETTLRTVLRNVQDMLMPYSPKNGGPNIMCEAFNRITLSNQAVMLLDKVSAPYSYIETLELAPRSQLARIMYEADYALKSRLLAPELFAGIPGMRSETEYLIETNALSNKKEQFFQAWLEPKSVAMAVSPGGRLVTFGTSEILYSTKPMNEYFELTDEHVDSGYADWSARMFRDNYEAYARVVPAFHKLREAAKAIALAKWALDEKVRLDLGAIDQESWDPPSRVPASWALNIAYFKLPNDDYTRVYFRGVDGGVSFKEKGNWTRITQGSQQSETRLTDKLAISAGLGQKAVQAAQGGDLEQARHLAELSAQAMNGTLSRDTLARMNIALPDAGPAPVSPAGVQLQKELIRKTHRQIVALGRNPSPGGTAASELARMNGLYDQLRDKPAAASDYLLQLQTGRLPAAEAKQPAVSWPPAGSACDERSPGDTMMAADRKAYQAEKLGEARDRLRHINKALRKLIDINASQRAEIDKLTAEISAQYDEAKDRAWDVAIDLLSSVSLDAFGAEQAKRMKGIDDAIKGKIALKSTPLDAGTLLKTEEEIRLLQSAKFRSEEAHESTAKLIDLYKGVEHGEDIEDWRLKNQSEWDRAKSGVALAGNLAIEFPPLERWLGRKAFFAGEKLWQVAAMGRMAYYAWGFYLDLLTQRAIWEPMANSLQNELQYNVQAMEHLRQSAERTSQEIRCLETILK